MHSKPLFLLFPKALLLATGLLSCAIVFANETALSLNKQDNVNNSETSSTETLNKQNTKSSLNNPNAALVAMAFKFSRIDGSPNSYAEVVANYCKQAKTGDADALFALAWMYENGKGVAVDKSIATQLYAKAAEQGHSSAQQSVARISGVQSTSVLPNCLLPDPPVAKTNTLDQTGTEERKGISEKTAALFYSQRHVLKLVNKLAPRYKIDTNLVMAFIAVESGFNVQATSVKNAQGLMQLIPETAQRFGVKDAYKAEDNIKGGLAYLRWLLAYYKGDVELVAAAYNAGEGAVDKYKGVPPYPETRMYVKKIANLYNNNTHPYQDNFVKASVIHNFPKKKTM
jgi:TPR repeat protein